jgi:hypothetical protein
MSNEVWARVVVASRPYEADADENDHARDHDDAGDDRPFRRDYVALDIPGLPPGVPGGVSPDGLRAAIDQARVRAELPIKTPVIIGLTLWLEPGAPDPPTDAVLAATIQGLVSSGVLASPSLVWELRFARMTEEPTRFDLTIAIMTEEQVEAVASLDEPWLDDESVDLNALGASMFPPADGH